MFFLLPFDIVTELGYYLDDVFQLSVLNFGHLVDKIHLNKALYYESCVVDPTHSCLETNPLVRMNLARHKWVIEVIKNSLLEMDLIRVGKNRVIYSYLYLFRYITLSPASFWTGKHPKFVTTVNNKILELSYVIWQHLLKRKPKYTTNPFNQKLPKKNRAKSFFLQSNAHPDEVVRFNTFYELLPTFAAFVKEKLGDDYHKKED
jgi:hypothetical protein